MKMDASVNITQCRRKTMAEQRGSAGLTIVLNNSRITVRRMDDGVVLKKFLAKDGDWKRLWLALCDIEEGKK
tara:strand:- start:762 stop:977 length:216 start_codon:yes stop_codon:yes gene_type:complete